MSFAVNELKKILGTTTQVDGVVDSVVNGVVKIASPKGLVTARSLVSLSKGDRVRVEGGIAYPLSTPTRSYPV